MCRGKLARQQFLLITDKAMIMRLLFYQWVQKGSLKGLRSPGQSVDLECLSLALHRSSLNTHSSALRSGESHHTSLATGSRRTWGSGATILTSGTLRTGGTRSVVRTKVCPREGRGDE